MTCKVIILVPLILIISCVKARGINGGISCAACTITFGIADQLAEIHNETVLEASLRLCKMLPNPAVAYCNEFVRTVEPILNSRELSKYFTPDVFCYSIGVCYIDNGSSFCHLFPRPFGNFRNTVHQVKKLGKSFHNGGLLKYFDHRLRRLGYAVCHLPGIKQICDLFNNTVTKIEPAIDLDGDHFSIVTTARGYHWRGRDCEDWNVNSYPGRNPTKGDIEADYNCNGIWGKNDATGESYEEELCGNTGARGLIVIGDSVSAHFHFPEAWMNPILISEAVLHNYTDHLLDELDWPHLGYATGFMNSTEPMLIKGRTDSIYLKLRSRNLCNHRDYQNLCRNGDSSFDAVRYIKSLSRNNKADKPAVVLYGLFGNDVCNNHADTVRNMTLPKDFHYNVLQVLNALDATLPNGSHVVLIGLVDGSFIYPQMANRLHPLGKLRGDVYYRDVYKWFTCMEIGPCTGWMTSNETLRTITTKRAIELTEVLKDLTKTKKFNSFKLHYLDNPMNQVFNEWVRQGKEIWQLIEPVDSFHPNQIAQPLIANAMWNMLIEKFPTIFGTENVNNEKILEVFGNQGGH